MKIREVEQWAKDRGLDTTDQPEVQFIKLVEEIGELNEAIFPDEFEDAIGDSLIVMIIIAYQNGIDFEEILDGIYYVIDPEMSIGAIEAEAMCDVNKALGRLARAYCRDQAPSLKVTLTKITSALAKMGNRRGVNLRGALDRAYNNIRDRKGERNCKGVFIKDDC